MSISLTPRVLIPLAFPFVLCAQVSLCAVLSACSSDAKSPSQTSAANPDDPQPTDPVNVPSATAAPDQPPTPERLAEKAVNTYIEAMKHGDVPGMRALMGGEMGTQFDRAVAQMGQQKMSDTVRRGIAFRTLGPARHMADGTYVVSCSASEGALRVDFDVQQVDGAFRLYRLSRRTPPVASNKAAKPAATAHP